MAPSCRTHNWETVLAGQWQEIGDASLQDALETAFAAASDGYQYQARGYSYEIDFSRMVQLNLSTKRERNLRRVLDPKAGSAATTAPATVPSSLAPPAAATATSAPTAAVASRGPRSGARAAAPRAKLALAPRPRPLPAPAASAPAAPARGPPRPQGTVKSFFKDKGYGFITLDSGDVFFHTSALVGDSVKANDTVEVLVTKDRAGRSRASEVRLLKKGSIYRLICRNRCCQAKGDRHFEDRCPRGGFQGDDASVSTAAS